MGLEAVDQIFEMAERDELHNRVNTVLPRFSGLSRLPAEAALIRPKNTEQFKSTECSNTPKLAS